MKRAAKDKGEKLVVMYNDLLGPQGLCVLNDHLEGSFIKREAFPGFSNVTLRQKRGVTMFTLPSESAERLMPSGGICELFLKLSGVLLDLVVTDLY